MGKMLVIFFTDCRPISHLQQVMYRSRHMDKENGLGKESKEKEE